MAPSISDLPPVEDVKSTAKTVPLAYSNGYNRNSTEEDSHNHNLDNLNHNTTSEEETSTPTFRYTSTQKLRNAQRRVEHDFRSDTVTVPTEDMMQVSSADHFLCRMMDTCFVFAIECFPSWGKCRRLLLHLLCHR
jgi:threonine aldolase